MTRRLRWLVIGAVIGIAGYRRLTRASLPAQLRGAPSGSLARSRPRLDRAGLPALPARLRAMPAFLRDVRAGMAEYEQQYRAKLARRHEAGRDNQKAGR
jgi:hypothetical protein